MQLLGSNRYRRRRMSVGAVALCLLAGLAAWAQAAPEPMPGAWIHSEPKLAAGVVIDWADWEDSGAAMEARATLDTLMNTDRVGSVYLYVFSDGHTICPLPGLPFPSLDIASGPEALGHLVQRLQGDDTRVYAVVDLLEWHRPGSGRQNPLDGDLSGLAEAPVGEPRPLDGGYASIAHPRTRELLTSLLAALADPDIGFDGIVLDCHLTGDDLLGGSEATLAAYAAETGADPASLVMPPASVEDLDTLSEFAAWRDRYTGARLTDLAKSLGEDGPDVGLLGRADYWGLSDVERENLGQTWPGWMGGAPYTVLLLEGDYSDPSLVASFFGTREGVLNHGCPAAARPVLDHGAPLEEIAQQFTSTSGPVDEMVVRLKPGMDSGALGRWAASLPKTCPLPAVLPPFLFMGLGEMESLDLRVVESTPGPAWEALQAAAAEAGLPPLAIDEEFAQEVIASSMSLSATFEDAFPLEPLTWYARAVHGCYQRTSEGLALCRLPSPQRVMADRLQQFGWFESAEESYSSAIEHGVDLAPAHRGLGDTLRKMWRAPEALEEYDQAYRLGLRDPEFLMEAGNCFRDAGQYGPAGEFLMQAIDTCPEWNIWVRSWASVGLGKLYDTRQDPEEALIWFQAAVDAWEGNALAHYWLGKTLVDLGRQEEAATSLRRCLELDPAIAPAESLLGRLQGAGR
ncbi:MAG: tetratricopeptide repeat protein [Armatimonadia bacterium]|nr:tetratricopeptide repeat protein [Armatimonadia bacterium]